MLYSQRACITTSASEVRAQLTVVPHFFGLTKSVRTALSPGRHVIGRNGRV